MLVAIAGAHGKIAMRLIRLLAGRGDEVIGLIRNREHEGEVRQAGAKAVVCDLERANTDDVTVAIAGAEAAVFAAGAGPGSGPERKLTMDRDGAVKLLEAAGAVGVGRFVIVSSVGAENPPEGDDGFSVYLRAKAEADAAVKASDREWTIVRPGRLTDDAGTGQVRLDTEPFRGEVTRDDVAALIGHVLPDDRFASRVLYINGGETPIEQALEDVLRSA